MEKKHESDSLFPDDDGGENKDKVNKEVKNSGEIHPDTKAPKQTPEQAQEKEGFSVFEERKLEDLAAEKERLLNKREELLGVPQEEWLDVDFKNLPDDITSQLKKYDKRLQIIQYEKTMIEDGKTEELLYQNLRRWQDNIRKLLAHGDFIDPDELDDIENTFNRFKISRKNGIEFNGNLVFPTMFPIKSLPPDLKKINGNADLSGCGYLERLPKDLEITESLRLRLSIKVLPKGLKIRRDLILDEAEINDLPDDIDIDGKVVIIGDAPESLTDKIAQLEEKGRIKHLYDKEEKEMWYVK